MKLSSSTFNHKDFIPEYCAFCIKDSENHTAFGDNKNPQLSWSEIPTEAKSLILICVDTSVPSSLDNFNKEGKTIAKNLPRVEFIHWVMIDILPSNGAIKEGECSDGITPGGKTRSKWTLQVPGKALTITQALWPAIRKWKAIIMGMMVLVHLGMMNWLTIMFSNFLPATLIDVQ